VEKVMIMMYGFIALSTSNLNSLKLNGNNTGIPDVVIRSKEMCARPVINAYGSIAQKSSE
jgi:hypothetical protein